MIAAVGLLVVTEAANGEFSAVVADAEQFAGFVLEEVLALVKQTPIVSIGLALLKAIVSPEEMEGSGPGRPPYSKPAGRNRSRQA